MDDITLKQKVLEKLLTNGEVDTHNFNVEVEDGVVKLDGEVSGRHAKKVIENCLAEIEDIRNVEMHLKIQRVARFSDNSMHGF